MKLGNTNGRSRSQIEAVALVSCYFHHAVRFRRNEFIFLQRGYNMDRICVRHARRLLPRRLYRTSEVAVPHSRQCERVKPSQPGGGHIRRGKSERRGLVAGGSPCERFIAVARRVDSPWRKSKY